MAKGIFNRVQVELDSRDKSPGLNMMDMLEMPDALRDLLQWMMKQDHVPASDIAARLGKDPAGVRTMLEPLIEKGQVVEFEIKSKLAYRVRLAAKRKRDVPSDIWQALNDKIE